jgi:flagellar hook assembly protein FlgD
MAIYPNPNAGGLFNVALTKFGKRESVNITIQDVSGRVMQSKTVVTNDQGAIMTEWNMKSKLGLGVYMIKAQSVNCIRVKKMLVH